MTPLFRRSRLLLALLASFGVACSDNGPGDDSPLEGLSVRTASDSAGATVPPAPSEPSPGTFRGTVLGAAEPGSGNDSLTTMPRIVGARVSAYPVVDNSVTPPRVGVLAATLLTDANGRFELPQLPGGLYVVTVEPPAGSAFGGVWVSATAHSLSAEHPWWVVLWRR
jgi:hypothetical protein